jgi:hypothetical protein
MAAAGIPLISFVLMLTAVLQHFRNPDKATDMATFCVESDVPIVRWYHHPCNSLCWLREPRPFSDFRAGVILGRLRIARRSRRPLDADSLFAFLRFKGTYFAVFQRVFYRDYPLSGLWLSSPWSTRVITTAKLVCSFGITVGICSIRHIFSNENLPQFLDEMEVKGATVPVVYDRIYEYSLDEGKWENATLLVIFAKLTSIVVTITLSMLFRRIPIRVDSAEGISRMIRKQRLRECLGLLGCFLGYTISSFFVVGAFYGLITKQGIRELLASIAIAVTAKFVLLPLLGALVTTHIILKAQRSEAYDGILTLFPQFMSFQHETLPHDTTGQLRVFLRDIGVTGCEAGNYPFPKKSSGHSPRGSVEMQPVVHRERADV